MQTGKDLALAIIRGGGGKYFLLMGSWGCAAGWGRIFTTGLTIMGLHFQQEFPTKLLEWGRNLSGFWGKKILARFAVQKKVTSKSCYTKNCTAVDLIFTSRITFRFGITIKRLL